MNPTISTSCALLRYGTSGPRRFAAIRNLTLLASLGAACLAPARAVADESAAAALGVMYWTHRGEGIYRAARDGSEIKLIVPMKNVDGLAIDEKEKAIYFTLSKAPELNADKLLRATLDGEDVTELATGLNYSGDLVFDPDARKIYVSVLVGRKIVQCNPDGTEMKDFLTGLINPDEMAIDHENRQLYWSHSGVGGPIQRAKLDDGGELKDAVASRHRRMGVAIDPGEKHVYWVEADQNAIYRTNFDDTGEKLIVGGRNGLDALAIDLDNRKLYWTETGKICQANLDGTGIEVLVSGKTEQYASLVILPPKE